jgi:hypothetical protein
MVVPDQLIEAKSIQGAKRQPIHDARFGTTAKNIIWETYRCGFNDLFYLMGKVKL